MPRAHRTQISPPASARKAWRLPGLGVRYVPGEQLTQAQRDEMFAIREANMTRVGGRGADADRAVFEARLRDSVAVLVTAGAGQLVAFYLAIEYRFEGPEGSGTVLCGDYLQALPEHRGRAALYISGAVLGLRHLLTALRGRLYMGGPYLPNSYIFTQRVTRMWCLQEPERPPQVTAMLHALGQRLGGAGFDPEQGTVPGTARPGSRRPRSEASRRLLEQYEAYNPDWLRGTELVCVGLIRPGVFVRALRIAAQRATGQRGTSALARG